MPGPTAEKAKLEPNPLRVPKNKNKNKTFRVPSEEQSAIIEAFKAATVTTRDDSRPGMRRDGKSLTLGHVLFWLGSQADKRVHVGDWLCKHYDQKPRFRSRSPHCRPRDVYTIEGAGSYLATLHSVGKKLCPTKPNAAAAMTAAMLLPFRRAKK